MAVTIYGSFYLKGGHLAHEKEEVEKKLSRIHYRKKKFLIRDDEKQKGELFNFGNLTIDSSQVEAFRINA